MIDRANPRLVLSGPWISTSALISALLCAALPTVALVVWLLGCTGAAVVWVGGWLINLIVTLAAIGGAVAVVAGIIHLGGGGRTKQDEGCGLVFLGALALGLWSGIHAPGLAAGAWVRSGSWVLFDWGVRGAGYLLGTIWLGYNVVLLSWVVLLIALLGSLVALAVIGLLRLHDRALGPLQRIYLACPNGHRAGVSFACPACGAWEDRLVSSMYGILEAHCVCSGVLPTSHLNGRSSLRKRCLACESLLTHPDLGIGAEYHVAVWGAADAGTSDWLSHAVSSATGAGARVAPGGPGPLPAPVIAFSGTVRRLLYLYDLAVAEPAAEFPHRLDAVALVVNISGYDGDASSHPDRDRIIPSLLDRWDRLYVGRIQKRHNTPMAVVIRGVGRDSFAFYGEGPRAPRAVLESAGFANTLRVLEARFRCVRYFTFDPTSPGSSRAECQPHEPLEWIGREVR